MAKSKTVTFSLTDYHMAKLEAEATRLSLGVSELLRRMIDERIPESILEGKQEKDSNER